VIVIKCSLFNKCITHNIASVSYSSAHQSQLRARSGGTTIGSSGGIETGWALKTTPT